MYKTAKKTTNFDKTNLEFEWYIPTYSAYTLLACLRLRANC